MVIRSELPKWTQENNPEVRPLAQRGLIPELFLKTERVSIASRGYNLGIPYDRTPPQ
jgi:hypothetical protein